MLEFAEGVLREIRKLEKDSEQIVLGGTVTDMERNRFLMGRLEGIRMSEEIVLARLKKYTTEG